MKKLPEAIAAILAVAFITIFVLVLVQPESFSEYESTQTNLTYASFIGGVLSVGMFVLFSWVRKQ